jgi:hypothetical protein
MADVRRWRHCKSSLQVLYWYYQRDVYCC